jgi:hypothetical protein
MPVLAALPTIPPQTTTAYLPVQRAYLAVFGALYVAYMTLELLSH